MCWLLRSVMELEELEIGMPEKPLPTVEEHDEEVRAYFGLCSDERTQPEPAEPRSATAPTRHKDRTPRQTKRARPKRSNSKARRQKRPQPPDPELPWAWTGQDAPVGPLMHLAIVRRRSFARCFRPRCRGQPHGSAAAPSDAPGRKVCAWRNRSGCAKRAGVKAELRKIDATTKSRKSPFLRTTYS